MRLLLVLIFTLIGASPQALAQTLEQRGQALQAEHQKLVELETQYIQSHQESLRTLQSPDEISKSIREFVLSLDANELASLGTTGAAGLTPGHQRQFIQLQTQLSDWFAVQSKHQAKIDVLNLEKFNYFVKQLRLFADMTHDDLLLIPNPEVSPTQQLELMRLYHNVKVAHEAYLSHLNLYGTPKDTLRLIDIRETFLASKKFFTYVDKMNRTPKQKLQVLLDKTRRFPGRFLEKLKLLTLAPDAIKGGADVLFNGGGKFNNIANDAFVKAAKIKGYDVTIEGMEYIKALAQVDAKTINIITAVHRGPVLDNMVLATLGLKDYVYVTSFGSVIPPKLAAQMQDSPGLAFVGPGFPNGIETVSSKGANHPEKIVVNYAEGSIGNMGETRPIAVKFSTALIPAIQAKGFRVNLIPLTSTPASFLKKDLDADMIFGKLMHAKVHQPISNEMIEFLKASGQLEQLGILIRATWLSALETDLASGGKLIEGSLSVSGMEEMIRKYLFPESPLPSRCEILFSGQ